MSAATAPTTAATIGITVYADGFEEAAHRLFAYHGTDVPSDAKSMCTVVSPDVLAENGVEPLKAKEDRGLITWPSVRYWPADETTTAEVLVRRPELQPFIFRLADDNGGQEKEKEKDKEGRCYDHVHLWAVNMNEQWRAQFNPTETNPDESVFHPRHVEQFRCTLRAMMGQDRADRMPIYFGTRVSVNPNPVYVGTPAAFLRWLRIYGRGSAEWEAAMVSDIREEGEEKGGGLTTTIVGLLECQKRDADGNKLPRTENGFEVSLADDAEECAFYVKEGYHRMFCVTSMRLFLEDRKLLGTAASL